MRILSQHKNSSPYNKQTAKTAAKLKKYMSKTQRINESTARAPEILAGNVNRPIELKH
jgi:hypothetical protein